MGDARQSGFTLVELLIVVLIIGILATIAIPVFNGQRNKAKNSAAKSAVRNAHTAVRTYHASNQSYAGLLTALSTEEASLTNGNAAGDPMWVTSGNPDTYRPGGTSVDPQRIRVYLFPGNQCVSLGSLSKGDTAYMIVDCQEPLVGWPYAGVPTDLDRGVYYGASKAPNGLSSAESEIMNERRTQTFDED